MLAFPTKGQSLNISSLYLSSLFFLETLHLRKKQINDFRVDKQKQKICEFLEHILPKWCSIFSFLSRASPKLVYVWAMSTLKTSGWSLHSATTKKWVQKRVKAPVAATPSVASLEQTLLIHIAHPEQLLVVGNAKKSVPTCVVQMVEGSEWVGLSLGRSMLSSWCCYCHHHDTREPKLSAGIR